MQVAFSSLALTVVPASGLGGLSESAIFKRSYYYCCHVSLMIVGKYPWMLVNHVGV
jgi:hypothetical protein